MDMTSLAINQLGQLAGTNLSENNNKKRSIAPWPNLAKHSLTLCMHYQHIHTIVMYNEVYIVHACCCTLHLASVRQVHKKMSR